MPLQERWSEQAKTDYLLIVAYLLENWSKKRVENFIEKVEQRILLIRQMPFMYKESEKKKGIRKGLINKYVSIYYRVNGDIVEIVSLSDNRRHPDKHQL